MIYGGAYRALQHLRALKARAVHFVGHLARAVQTKIADAASWGYHAATTAWDTGVSIGSRVVHAVTRWAAPYYQKAVHIVHTAFNGGGPAAQQARLFHRNGNLMGHLGIEPTGPTAGLYRDMTRSYAGGWRSFLGGMGQPLASLLDLASCAGDALQCARDQATGSTYSASYLHWLHGQGVLTGASSWFGAGAGTADFITAMLGSMAGGTETAATSITDLAPEAGTGAVSGGVRSFSARWPGGSPFFSAVRSAGGSWQVTRGVAQDVGSASAGAPATYAAQIAEEDEAGVSGVLKDPQNLIDAGNQMFNDVVQSALPQGTPYAVTHASWGDPLLGACVAAAVIIKMRGCP